jgi:two-component system phosphate regulon response regulator PhoB/two-component system alkaline phosphatase synthesis response regulator PhoP
MGEMIAVVDDEADITRLVALHLQKSQFRVREFHDAKSFQAFLKSAKPDLLILDLMLPDIDGLELCRSIKMDARLSSIPIIMLTAKAEETDRIVGLEIGADDYVTKPFSPKELVARVRAVLRRKGAGFAPPPQDIEKLRIGDSIEIDMKRYVVTIENRVVNLTTTEFKILRLLASRQGWVYSRESILESLWGNEKYVIDRTVDVHIRHLREKLGNHGHIIKNVRGVGYKLET